MTSLERLNAMVDKFVADVSEYSDSVQVFVTAYEPTEAEGTVSIISGNGNWYARYGQVKAFAATAEAQEIESQSDEE